MCVRQFDHWLVHSPWTLTGMKTRHHVKAIIGSWVGAPEDGVENSRNNRQLYYRQWGRLQHGPQQALWGGFLFRLAFVSYLIFVSSVCVCLCVCTKGLGMKNNRKVIELTLDLACLSVHLSHAVLRRQKACLIKFDVHIAEREFKPDRRFYQNN